MALTATIYTFDIELADSDRHVYESLALRVARHPSESEGYLLTRVLAYALEFTDGIEFSRGLFEPDAPAIAIRDLTGAIRSWIDIGMPDASRLHRAGKAAARVAVYTHKDPALLVRQLARPADPPGRGARALCRRPEPPRRAGDAPRAAHGIQPGRERP